MTPETKAAILRGLRNDIGNAADNLHRATCAFRGHSAEELQQQYGQGGSTCAEILEGYQTWHDKAVAALREAEEAL
jgi:hypothetical protein